MTPRIAIAGAGIIGAPLADQLAGSAATVTLIDAGQVGHATSATSLAWINANQKTPRSYYDLNLAGMRAWRELAAQFHEPSWYVPSGHLTWATTARDRQELADRVAHLRSWGYDAHSCTPPRAMRREPGVTVPANAGVAYFPEEAYAHAGQAAAALTERAHARGATVRTHDAVAGIETRAGKICGAQLASGTLVPADVVVIAAGHRSPELAGDVDLVPPEQPQSEAVCLVATTTPTPARPRHILRTPHVRIRAGAGGGLHLEASDINADIDLTSTEAQLNEAAHTLLNRARSVWPASQAARIEHVQRCIRPLPRDGYPITGWAPSTPGLYLAVTHSGVTLAPHLAGLITSEILHDQPTDALNPYRPRPVDPET